MYLVFIWQRPLCWNVLRHIELLLRVLLWNNFAVHLNVAMTLYQIIHVSCLPQNLKMYLHKQNLDPVKCKIPRGKTNVAFITFRNEAAREVGRAYRCMWLKGTEGIGWWQCACSDVNTYICWGRLPRSFLLESARDLVLRPTQCLHIIVARC